MSYVSELAGKKCLVIGAGVTGQAVDKALKKFGAISYLFDEKTNSKLNVVDQIPQEIDFAVVSPGWRANHPVILNLKSLGIEIIGEVDFAWKIKMVESIFKSAKINGAACGNVGQTVIESVMQEPALDYLALELSSFQIHWSELPKYESVALLNIAEDHIDWHGNFDNYAQAKLKLLKQAKKSFVNKSDKVLSTKVQGGSVIWFSLDTPQPGELGVVENLLIDRAFSPSPSEANEISELVDITPTVPHNIMNALAASALALSLGVKYQSIKEGLKNFSTDHHRMELVLSKGEINWVDDSKATNPHAAIASLLSYFNVIWIAGGLAKGASMDELAKRAGSRIKSIILIGQDREIIAQAFAQHSPTTQLVRVDQTNDAKQLMKDVVAEAKKTAQSGDTVLLAPACASMDQFDSYVERGQLFAQAIKELV
jgi:UDP-N-acetylmuramoylalanine--D-glutamate ligase